METARIDGAGRGRFFFDIVLPLSRTMIAALFVIEFIYGFAPGSPMPCICSIVSLASGSANRRNAIGVTISSLARFRETAKQSAGNSFDVAVIRPLHPCVSVLIPVSGLYGTTEMLQALRYSSAPCFVCLRGTARPQQV